MNFYRLEYEHKQEIVGATFPQSQKIVIDNIDWQSPNHIMSVWGKFPSDIHIPDSILHSRAKKTDLISSSPIRHPLISDKLKQIIETSRTDGLEFAPTGLITGRKRVPYWIMNGYIMDYQHINFNNSTIITVGIGQKKISNLEIKTAESLEAAIESMTVEKRVWIEKLVLLDDIKDDIFFLDRVDGSNYYVSERLKNKIVDTGCTGITFVKYTERYP